MAFLFTELLMEFQNQKTRKRKSGLPPFWLSGF